MTDPYPYPLCRQVVTVYRDTPQGIQRTLWDRAYFQLRRDRSLRLTKNRTVDAIGPQDKGEVLVVIPGPVQALYPGDKVLLGEGPEITTPEEWAHWIPSKVANLAVLTWAEPMYFQGRLVHTEGGC